MPFLNLGSHFVLACVAPSILFVMLRAPEPRINTQKTAHESIQDIYVVLTVNGRLQH